MLSWSLITAILVAICQGQENETTSIQTEEPTSPLPEFAPLIDPQQLYVAIKEHLGDHPHAHLVALRMVDASAKIPNGLLYSNFEDIGNFDECYSIHEGKVYGKYCQGIKATDAILDQISDDYKANITNLLGDYRLFLKRLRLHMGISMVPYRAGICIPHTMNAFLIPGDFIFMPDLCYTQLDQQFDDAAITTSVIIGIFFLISFISTLYEIAVYIFDLERPHWLLIAFSYVLNGKKLMKSSMSSQHELSCLRGIRVLSMTWIMWSHFYMLSFVGNIQNKSQLTAKESEWYNMVIFNGQLAVDAFLLLGGLLVVYNFLIVRPSGLGHMVFFYAHRYLRVTPLYAVLIFLHRNVLPLVGNGPSWQIVRGEQNQCIYGWWSNLLYLANYIHKDVCIGHTYYLHIDMQLYFLSPLVLYPMLKYPKTIVSGLGVLAVASVVIAYISAVPIRAGPFYLNIEYFHNFIIPTHTRFGSYIIGMILGYFIYTCRKQNLVLGKSTILSLWVASLAIMIACIFGSYQMLLADEYDIKTHALYISLNRPVFAIAVSVLVFLCIIGYGGFINSFLSHPIFIFMSKLTFTFYLVHMILIAAYFVMMRTQTSSSMFYMMSGFWGLFAYTMMVSIPLTLTFEAPMLIFEKMLLRKQFSQKPKVKGVEETSIPPKERGISDAEAPHPNEEDGKDV